MPDTTLSAPPPPVDTALRCAICHAPITDAAPTEELIDYLND